MSARYGLVQALLPITKAMLPVTLFIEPIQAFKISSDSETDLIHEIRATLHLGVQRQASVGTEISFGILHDYVIVITDVR